jgi:hypothetical protein
VLVLEEKGLLLEQNVLCLEHARLLLEQAVLFSEQHVLFSETNPSRVLLHAGQGDIPLQPLQARRTSPLSL